MINRIQFFLALTCDAFVLSMSHVGSSPNYFDADILLKVINNFKHSTITVQNVTRKIVSQYKCVPLIIV
jgi:cysteinyl-tRNA synthetase